MTPRGVSQTGVLALLVLAMAVPVWSADPSPSVAQKEPGRVTLPPFQVAGTVIAPSAKMALIVQGDEAGGQWVEEGDTIHGYRVIRISERTVTFERDGQTVVVILGRAAGRLQLAAPDKPGETPPPILFIPAGGGPALVPDLPAKRRGDGPPVSPSPSPARVENVQGEKADVPLESLVQDPQFRENLEHVRTLLRQRLQTPVGGQGRE